MITQEEIKRIAQYDPETGIMSWNIKRKGTKGIGNPLGTLAHNGYVDVCISGKKYGVHRLIFLYMTGIVPKCVDHINGCKSDNRWINLRSASYRENGYNYKGTGSSTGLKNVYFDKRGRKHYFVQIVINGIPKLIGYYLTPEEANEAAIEARNKYHGEFAHHG